MTPTWKFPPYYFPLCNISETRPDVQDQDPRCSLFFCREYKNVRGSVTQFSHNAPGARRAYFRGGEFAFARAVKCSIHCQDIHCVKLSHVAHYWVCAFTILYTQITAQYPNSMCVIIMHFINSNGTWSCHITSKYWYIYLLIFCQIGCNWAAHPVKLT